MRKKRQQQKADTSQFLDLDKSEIDEEIKEETEEVKTVE